MALIGDRVQVREGSILDGSIRLDVVQHGPTDAQRCLGTNATRSWTLDNRRLIEGAAETSGRSRSSSPPCKLHILLASSRATSY